MIQGQIAPSFALQSIFELQIFRDGRWMISAIYDERNLALSEARRLDRAGRMVRLREESGNGWGVRTVFLSARIKNSWKVERQRIAARAARMRVPPPVAAPTHNESNAYHLAAMSSLVFFCGIAAIFALRTLSASV